jgi:hypothetical protein
MRPYYQPPIAASIQMLCSPQEPPQEETNEKEPERRSEQMVDLQRLIEARQDAEIQLPSGYFFRGPPGTFLGSLSRMMGSLQFLYAPCTQMERPPGIVRD